MPLRVGSLSFDLSYISLFSRGVLSGTPSLPFTI